MTWLIIPILVLVFLLYLKFKAGTETTIIGRQALVEYFDQNTDFENIFPLTGTVTQKIKVGIQDFFVVKFDHKFVYDNMTQRF